MEKKEEKSMWTQFMDMYSGGGSKLEWNYIYIEAPIDKAKIIFQNKFGRNPEKVTCTCCGADYSINESESLEQATGYERNCRYAYFDKEGKEVHKDIAWVSGRGLLKGLTEKYIEESDNIKIKEMTEKYPDNDWEEYYKYLTLQEYKEKKNILIISKNEIKKNEYVGRLKKEGYVWID